MSTDALLTLIGLIVAVLTLMSPERRLDLRVRTTWADWAVGIGALAMLHAIKFTPLWEAQRLPTLGPWRWGFDADLASYAILCVAAAFLAVRIKYAKLRPHRIGAFSDQCELLLFSGQYSTLLFLLEKNIAALQALVAGKHLVSRLERFVRPKSDFESFMGDFVRRQEGKPRSILWDRFERGTRPTREAVADRLPTHEDEKQKAQRLFGRVLLSEPFVDYLAKAKPYFALDVLRFEGRFFHEQFLKMYIVALLRNRTSVLYEEVRDNQKGGGLGYIIDSLNRFIFYFFGDEEFRAEALYKPVGDAVSAELDRLQKVPTDPYATEWRSYEEADRWTCSIFIGIRLFDFLVTEGLRRGIHYHLWLMYLEYWLDEILRNLRARGDWRRDEGREPTAYHHLIWQIVGTITDWARMVPQVSRELDSVKIESQKPEYENLAKSIALALGTCVRATMESDQLSPKFKGRIFELVLSNYEHLKSHPAFAEFYQTALMSGGVRKDPYDAYRAGLAEAFANVDELRLRFGPARDLYDTLFAMAHRGLSPDDRVRKS